MLTEIQFTYRVPAVSDSPYCMFIYSTLVISAAWPICLTSGSGAEFSTPRFPLEGVRLQDFALPDRLHTRNFVFLVFTNTKESPIIDLI
jgi:hypothetical protein